MSDRKTIAVLFHESTPPSRFGDYRVRHCAQFWRQWGIEVRFVQGPNADVEADLLIPHIDLSVIPDSYVLLFDKAKMVVNRHLIDIRKTTFSRNLVTPDDDYDGPVIVKTNLNYAGLPEKHLFGKPPLGRRVGQVLRRFAETRSLSKLAYTSTLKPRGYPVYPSKDRLPRGVFTNSDLVVERFLPEKEGDSYFIRLFYCLGTEYFTIRMRSTSPVIKGSNCTDPEFVESDPSIVAARREIGLDFGKLDYVMHDGRAVLLDVNRTPTLGRQIFSEELLDHVAGRLASGVRQWFPELTL